MSDTPIFVGSVRNDAGVIIAAHSTTVAVRCFLAGASGSRVHAISAANTDAGASDVTVYTGRPMTLESAMGTGAFVDNGGSSDTITRSSGSFVTDGWLVGDRMFVYGPTTLLNGVFFTLTAVSAGTLTFATAKVDTAENFPTGAIIYRLAQLHLTTLAANAGNLAATDALDLLGTDYPAVDATPDRYITLGPLDIIACSVGSAVGADPDRVDISCHGGDF